MTATTLSTLDRSRAYVGPALRAAIERLDPACRLVAAYHFGWCDEQGMPTDQPGGKAVRPALALLAAEAVGAPAETAVPGAVAVELVHNFSLLHDDLLDGDVERRHRRTVWAIWGPAIAILTGDALLALAHEVLLESPAPGAAQATWLLAAVTRELTRGQVSDIAFERRSHVSLDECFDMAAAKTGSLLGASTGIGALLAGAGPATVEALRTFGVQFGLAFQLVDDVLGVWGDPAVTGKPVHSDLRSRKKSFPVTYALGRADADPRLRQWLAGGAEPEPDGDSEPDPALLADVADLLEAAGARQWTLDEARRRMAAAEQALSDVDIKPQARADLLELAQFVVERQG
jgi:geranylgeranyl diphosphate synthase, type I